MAWNPVAVTERYVTVTGTGKGESGSDSLTMQLFFNYKGGVFTVSKLKFTFFSSSGKKQIVGGLRFDNIPLKRNFDIENSKFEFFTLEIDGSTDIGYDIKTLRTIIANTKDLFFQKSQKRHGVI
ncbi:hypothetical protein RF11_00973 [Thelohanellus kitauei]|uniref:Uncharacterized protein n=1 Tax=Thelohanellus kitauei TaxID=669202 RepID=A0A0C2MLE7_THEKT|nr:hypothetical protein RF11_00973 [Thelohanellus kitauei]